MATFGGLVRYDGLRFTVFNPGNAQGLRSGRLLQLFEDREGNLWINTEGQGLTRYRDRVFTTYTTAQGLPDNRIERLSGDANGNLLIETSAGLAEWRDGGFIPRPRPASEAIAGFVHRTAGGAIWYTDHTGLHQLENGRLTLSLKIPGKFKKMDEDHEGRMWIGTDTNVLLKVEGGKSTIYSEKDGYPAFRLNNVVDDREGNVWVGSRGGGLLRYEDGKFIRYTTADGLAGNSVTVIYQDREGTVWLGTDGGLSRLSKQIITTYSTANGLAAKNVYPIYQDREGTIWIGCWLGLTCYRNGVFTAADQSYGVSHALVTSLFEDRDGNLWVGVLSQGVRRISKDKKAILSPNELRNVTVRAILQDHDGNLWFGTSGGLVRYDGAAWTTFTPADGLPGNEVFVIAEDRQGNLWAGTDGGLASYRDGILTAYTERQGFAADYVRAIYEDGQGTLWIGTYDTGLYRFKEGRFTRYTTNEGLFDNGAFQIIEDGRQNLWISCNLGIYSVRKAELDDFAEGRIQKISTTPYGRRDGMANSECNGGFQPAGIRASDGRIWFPTQEGVAVFAPDAIAINPEPPAVVIESFVSDNRQFDLREPVVVPPGQNYFEINCAGLSFIAPEQVRFKYKLERLDRDWVDAGTRRTAYYSHLPPGGYRFRVIAANRDGVWNEQGAALEIVVLAPFYRTGWFMALLVCGTGAIALSVFRRRIRGLKRAAQAREAFARQMIQSQESERQRIAAELHDGLGQSLILIRNWALLGLKASADRKPAALNLNEISETASQAINEVREIAYNLGPYQLGRLGLTNSILEMASKVNGSGGIELTAELEELDGLLPRESEISLYRIIQESLNNVIKHSRAARARLEIRLDAPSLIVKIEDDGSGFATGQAAATGFGLRGMAERVRMLGGTLGIISTPGAGTVINVNLPIDSDRGQPNDYRDKAADRR